MVRSLAHWALVTAGLLLAAGSFAGSALAMGQPLDFTPLQPLFYGLLGIATAIGIERLLRHAAARQLRTFTARALAVILILVVAGGMARAQDPGGGDTVVDLSGLFAILIDALAAVVLAAVTWAVSWVVRVLKLEKDAKIRTYLTEAIYHAVEYARDRAIEAGQDLKAVPVRSELVADAVDYLLPKVPDALAHFQIDRNSLAEMVKARLPPLDTLTLTEPATETGS